MIRMRPPIHGAFFVSRQPTVEASIVSRDGTRMLASRLTNETRLGQFFWHFANLSKASNSSVHSLDDAGVLLATTQAESG